ncbi:MAG TPA: hypothetical protein VM686_23455 [Polyangiaceae bacterium]|nr:hypothetical protein [Polyangiaceae bacterium]
MLDTILATPRLLETDHVDVEAPAMAVWNRIRHANLAQAPAIRALFMLRTLPARLSGSTPANALRLDDFQSSVGQPGFAILADDPPHEVVVGAIGKVWKLDIPFVHVPSARDFAAFAEPGFVKVAWALCCWPLDDRNTRVELEVRVTATDERSWRKFRRYFRVIGPFSRFIRRSLLASLERELTADGAKSAPRTPLTQAFRRGW